MKTISIIVYGEDGIVEGRIAGRMEDEETLAFVFKAFDGVRFVKMIPKPETLDRVAGLSGAFLDESFRGLMATEYKTQEEVDTCQDDHIDDCMEDR